MMSSRLVRKTHKPHGFVAFLNRFFARLKSFYQTVLTWSLASRPVVFLVWIVISLFIVPFWMLATKELAPREDQGVVFGIVQASPNSSLDQTLLYAEKINGIFQSFPECDQTFQLTGATFGFSGMVLKPWAERTRTAQVLEQEAFGRVAAIPGVRVIVTTPPPLPGGSDFPYEIVITTTDEPVRLVGFVDHLVKTAVESKNFMFADSDLKFDLPQSEIVLDRDKVASLGLNLSQVGQDLSSMMGGDYVNRFNIQGRSYKVIPQVERSERLNPEQLKDFYVTGPEGKLISLSTIATIKNTVEPRQLNRFQQQNSAKIQGAYLPMLTLDQALKLVEDEAAKILPQGYKIDYAGEARQLRTEGNALTNTLLIALVLIFLVLAAQFESFRDPFIILLGSVPLALSGAMMFVFLDFTTLNIYSQIGLVTLVGLVSKNGILIVEFANKLQESGLSKLDAVSQAAATRLRPILMTSVATVAGHFPLTLATGAGAGARNSIGIVLVSGMIIGTFFTLLVVPSIYMLMARDHGGRGGKKEEESVSTAEELAPAV